MTERTKTYTTTVVALKCKRANDIPFQLLRDADIVIVKGYKVVKDREGMEGTISAQRLEEIKADSMEVVTLNEFGRPVNR